MQLVNVWRGGLAATVLVSAVAVPALAESRREWKDQGGIRHLEIKSQNTTRRSSGTRTGYETTAETFTYWNVLDAVNIVVACSGLSGNDNDKFALVDAIKAGSTTVGTLKEAMCGAPGIPGTASLPSGFHGHNAQTWNEMGFDSTDFTSRYKMATTALGQSFTGHTMADAKAYVDRMIADGKLKAWDFSTIFNSVGWDFDFGSYTSPQDSYLKTFGLSGAPHFVPIIAERPGAALEAIYHDYGERGPIATVNDAQTYIATAYFLAESQRWLSARSLLSSLGAGGLANQAFNRARDDAGILSATGDPLVLDFNFNKFVDVTGRSSSHIRSRKNRGFVESGSVFFDLWGYGPLKTEWVKNGDAFLADANRMRAAAQTKRNLNGRDLFGDAEGYPGGFLKLAAFDKNRDMKIAGAELEALGVWIDANTDGEFQAGEFKSLKEIGVSEIGAKPRITYNKDHEPLEVAYFMHNGKKLLMQEVWFALESNNVAKGGR